MPNPSSDNDIEALWLLMTYKSQILGLIEIIKEYQELTEMLLDDKPEMRPHLDAINEKIARYYDKE